MTNRNFGATGQSTSDGHPIYRAVGPVSGRFAAGYEWRDKRNPHDTSGWVLAITTPGDLAIDVNRVSYDAYIRMMIEPAKGCDKEPGTYVSWHVKKQGGKWDDHATTAARARLEALSAEVYAEVHTPHALWQAKIRRAEEQIAALQDERAKYLAQNDAALDTAARRLSFHLDNPA